MKFVFIYLLIVNYIAFSLYHIDKDRAVKGKRRISEKNLLSIAAIGGSLGAYLGMKTYHHKTKKTSFKFWFYLIVVIQFLLFFMIYKRKFI